MLYGRWVEPLVGAAASAAFNQVIAWLSLLCLAVGGFLTVTALLLAAALRNPALAERRGLPYKFFVGLTVTGAGLLLRGGGGVLHLGWAAALLANLIGSGRGRLAWSWRLGVHLAVLLWLTPWPWPLLVAGVSCLLDGAVEGAGRRGRGGPDTPVLALWGLTAAGAGLLAATVSSGGMSPADTTFSALVALFWTLRLVADLDRRRFRSWLGCLRRSLSYLP